MTFMSLLCIDQVLTCNFESSYSDWFRCHGKKSVKQNRTENNTFSLTICVTKKGSNVLYTSLSGRLPVLKKDFTVLQRYLMQ